MNIEMFNSLPPEEREAFFERDHQRRINEQYKQINAFLSEGKEKEAAEIINLRFGDYRHEQQNALWLWKESFKDERVLFDLIIDVYTIDGYNFPKSIIQKAKRIAKTIPEEHRLKGLPPGDVIKVWRGADTPHEEYFAQNLRKDISWTTDKDCAIWFANRITSSYSPERKGAVWEAEINRDKIIAFTDERSESEVLQHMNVKNIHLLDIPSEEWSAALERRKNKLS